MTKIVLGEKTRRLFRVAQPRSPVFPTNDFQVEEGSRTDETLAT